MRAAAALKTWAVEGLGRASAVFHQAADYSSRKLAGWVPRRGTSADQELALERSTLVSRARDADRNNGVARSGISTIIDNVVGSGLRLSARPDYLALGQTKEWATAWAANVEARFHEWWWSTACSASDTLTGDQLSELALRANLMSGDTLALPLWLPKRGDGFATKLQMVEGDRLCNPWDAPDTTYRRCGIDFDETRMPLRYWFRNNYPGDSILWDTGQFPAWTPVPRRTPFGRLRVIHDFTPDRAEQTRGKPLLTAVMAHFKQADRYLGAELDAAVNNGLISGAIETPLDQDGILDLFSKDKAAYLKARDESAVRMEGGTLVPLFPGDKLQPYIPGRPNGAFGTFLENVFRIIAVGLDMPYELLLKDFSKTSYSSARASMLEAWRSFNRRRDRLGSGWMDPIYGLFLEELVNDGRIVAPSFCEMRRAYQRCRWIGPGKGWVDPVREAQAAQIRMDSYISTLEDECAEQGKDWREALEQRAAERAEMERLGLPDLSATRAANPVQSPAEQGAPARGQQQAGG
jgi:lambda family phage portal protein